MASWAGHGEIKSRNVRARIPGFLETVTGGLGWEGSWVLVLRALVQFKQVLQECTSVLFKNIH